MYTNSCARCLYCKLNLRGSFGELCHVCRFVRPLLSHTEMHTLPAPIPSFGTSQLCCVCVWALFYIDAPLPSYLPFKVKCRRSFLPSFSIASCMCRVGYKWCIYNILGRETTKCTVIYGVYIGFWPTVCMCLHLPFSAVTTQPPHFHQFCLLILPAIPITCLIPVTTQPSPLPPTLSAIPVT